MESTSLIERDHKVAAGGTWYRKHPVTLAKGQDLLLDIWNQQGKTGVPVAWDMMYEKSNGGKVHGVYPDMATLHAGLQNVANEYRCMYEIIPTDTHCHPYLDVEYLVRRDAADPDRHENFPDLEIMLMIARDVKAAVYEAYGIDAQIILLQGSRLYMGDFFKYSFHYIIRNISMDKNHDGCIMERMLSFGIESSDEKKQTSKYYWFDECSKVKGLKHVVDYGVYSRNRLMRMIGCSKKGSTVPLRRFMDPRYADLIDCTPADTGSLEEFSMARIVCADTPVTPFLPTYRLQKSIGNIDERLIAKYGGRGMQTKRTTQPAASSAPAAAGGRVYVVDPPFSKHLLQLLLQKRGDSVSAIRGIEMIGQDCFQVYCQLGSGCKRSCLHFPHAEHLSNNYYVGVTLVESGKCWDVTYRCLAPECKGIMPLNIGRFRNESYTPAGIQQPAAAPAVREMMPDGYFALRPADMYETYCEQLVRPLPHGHRVIAVCSPCGTGKTKATNNYVLNESVLRNLMVLYIHNRQVLSAKTKETATAIGGFPCAHYHDVTGEIVLNDTDMRCLAIQLESLSRISRKSLMDCAQRMELVVIVDEWNSIVRQMMSEAGDTARSSAVFHYLLQNFQVIAMDGYLDQNNLDILEKTCKSPAYLVNNTFKSRRRHNIKLSRNNEKTIKWMFDDIAKGGRHICPCVRKKTAKKLYARFKQRFGDTKKAIMITRDEPWDGKDVNKTWIHADFVVHTSSIDCGVSFEEIGHFTWCTIFAQNVDGPVAETVAQMLSRGRDIVNFHICCEAPKSSRAKLPTDLSVVLQAEYRSVAIAESMYVGSMTSFGPEPAATWENCTPVAAAVTLCKASSNNSQNDMMAALLELLERDGAEVCRRLVDFDESLDTPMDEGELSIESLVSMDDISKHYNDFDFAKFYDPVKDAAILGRYASFRLKDVYTNLNALAFNGINTADALRQITSDMTNFAAVLLKLEKKLGPSYGNTIDEARRRGGLIGKHYLLDANKAAVDIIQFVTGSSDPFDIPDQTSGDIYRRLECVALAVATPKKQTPKTVYFLSNAKRDQFLDLYNAWINVDIRKHSPRTLPSRYQCLNVQKAMGILNTVLSTMYDSSYTRKGSGRRTKAGRSHNYVLSLTDKFLRMPSAVQPEDYDVIKVPFIRRWWGAPLKDLDCSNLVEIDQAYGIVQPAARYFSRQGVESFSKRMRPVKPSDWGEIVAAAPAVDVAQDLFSNTPVQQTLMKHEEEKSNGKRKARDDMTEQKRQKTISQAHQSHGQRR